MGEEFLRKQARGYKGRRDRAAPEFCKEDLLSGRAAPVRRTVRFETSPGALIKQGESVLLCANGNHVHAVVGNEVVGTLAMRDANSISARLRVSGGMLAGAVREVSAIGIEFSVVVSELEA